MNGRARQTLGLVALLTLWAALLIAAWAVLAPPAEGQSRLEARGEAIGEGGATPLAKPLPISPQPKPVARPRVLDAAWWTVLGALAAAKAADGATTARSLSIPGHYERNPLFGPHPSPGRIAAVNAGYLGGEASLAYALKRLGRRYRSPWLRYAWMVEPTWQTSEHVRFAWENAGLPARRR